MKLRLGLLLGAVLVLPARAEDSFGRFRTLLIEYFAAQGFVPVLVDHGYQIGDVVNIDGVDLYARGTRCFPHLKIPPPTPSSLATVFTTDTIGMSLGLKLRQIFDSSAGADLARRVQISFSDVSITSVALLDLRDALDRAACPDIAPLVDGTITPLKPDERPYFVVSEVVSGRRAARLEFAARADLAAKTSQIMRQAADANLSVNASDDGSVLLSSEKIGLIALKPVTVPRVVTLRTLENGVRGGGTTDQQLRWQTLACPAGEDCTKRFSSFAEQVKAAPLHLSAAELEE